MYKEIEPVVVTENLRGGEYRKAIYACIQSTIKRDLTEAEHKYLSGILKLYASSHEVIQKVISAQAPIEHKWVCTNCATETVIVGAKPNKSQKKRAIKNKKLVKAKENGEQR